MAGDREEGAGDEGREGGKKSRQDKSKRVSYGSSEVYLIAFLSDPFADSKLSGAAGGGADELVHIRIQQRNGRKTLTTVQGIHEKYDKKKIVRVCKKVRPDDVG